MIAQEPHCSSCHIGPFTSQSDGRRHDGRRHIDGRAVTEATPMERGSPDLAICGREPSLSPNALWVPSVLNAGARQIHCIGYAVN